MQTGNLISIAKSSEGRLYLRKVEPKLFKWFQEETDTGIQSDLVTEAIRLAQEKWKSFKLLNCGYVYTLPERDEHGNNALFSQMAKSLDSGNGIYFDEDLGHNCIVQQIPLETARLYRSFK
jgi:hypothetical protein